MTTEKSRRPTSCIRISSKHLPMVFPRGQAKLGRALLTMVPFSPLGLLTEKVKKAEEQLLGGHLIVKDGYTLVVQRAKYGTCLDQTPTQLTIALCVGQEESCKRINRIRDANRDVLLYDSGHKREIIPDLIITMHTYSQLRNKEHLRVLPSASGLLMGKFGNRSRKTSRMAEELSLPNTAKTWSGARPGAIKRKTLVNQRWIWMAVFVPLLFKASASMWH